jgi:hypothetical protein
VILEVGVKMIDRSVKEERNALMKLIAIQYGTGVKNDGKEVVKAELVMKYVAMINITVKNFVEVNGYHLQCFWERWILWYW